MYCIVFTVLRRILRLLAHTRILKFDSFPVCSCEIQYISPVFSVSLSATTSTEHWNRTTPHRLSKESSVSLSLRMVDEVSVAAGFAFAFPNRFIAQLPPARLFRRDYRAGLTTWPLEVKVSVSSLKFRNGNNARALLGLTSCAPSSSPQYY